MKLYKCTLTGRPTCADQAVVQGITLCKWVDDKLHATEQVSFGAPSMHRRECEHAELFHETKEGENNEKDQ